MEQEDLHRQNEDGIGAEGCEEVGGERWEVSGVGDSRGDGMGSSASDVGSVVEEEDVDPREADERVDVEEEDAIEEGDVRHFGCGVDNHWAFRIFCLVQDM